MRPMRQQTPSDLELLVTVKAYPNPSRGLGEAACIAGVTRKQQLVRVYPVPFGKLQDEMQFPKYQWVSVPARRASGDPRPETYRPNLDLLRILPEYLDTSDNWWARKQAVMPTLSASLCDLQDSQKLRGTSLGFFKPAEVLDFDWEREESLDWTLEELAKLKRQDLFLTRENKLLEKIPFAFRYRFRCEGCRTKEPHHMKIVDWELMQLYRKMRDGCTSIEECLSKVRHKYLDDLCDPDKDTHFFVGTMQNHPTSFLVLGVFHPRKEGTKRLL